MRRVRLSDSAKAQRDRPKASATVGATRGLQAALEALYGNTTCELGEAGIAERDQRHREAMAVDSPQGCLRLVSRP